MPYKLSQDKRNNVKSLILKGQSTENIVKTTGVSKSTINRMKNQINPGYNRPKGGRPAILPETTKQIIRFKLRCGYLKVATDTQKYLNGLGYSISYTSTNRIIKKLGFKCKLKKKKAFLKKQHYQNRLKWARKHCGWTVNDWKKVIFSDESKINRWGSDGAEYTYKFPGDLERPHNVKTVLKHGVGSLMMWGCMTYFGPGYASRILEYPMNSDCYTHILGTSYKETLNYYGLTNNDVLFQQDGDPKHRSKHTFEWLRINKINYIKDWPANSPDLNPIEHLWHHLKLRLNQYDRKPTSLEDLWARIDLEWNKFTADDMKPYYEGLPRRIEEVIRAKGGYTKH
ncbi:hypothetical protein INT47_012776 [Mucor saturninus]|uniref:Tc1-like transposase DDE domain-containing protein n=1 Tax=Mucor saturninus TaxID=64648 RepID=A0A8H7QHK7_9FUNG|nr:hypothetical protein INT47_012776 [Mucor saturninus]